MERGTASGFGKQTDIGASTVECVENVNGGKADRHTIVNGTPVLGIGVIDKNWGWGGQRALRRVGRRKWGWEEKRTENGEISGDDRIDDIFTRFKDVRACKEVRWRICVHVR